MSGLKQVFILIACLTFSTTAQYVDDSDYEDYGAYGESIPEIKMQKQSIKEVEPVRDDFYMINDYGETMSQDDLYSINVERGFIPGNNDAIKPPKWLKVPAKIYQYTKHRIPGYDYDELDYMGGRISDRMCDNWSVFANCVCQFTCSSPNEVDCYKPCESGCQCREEFVFDENIQQCVPPEDCPNY